MSNNSMAKKLTGAEQIIATAKKFYDERYEVQRHTRRDEFPLPQADGSVIIAKVDVDRLRHNSYNASRQMEEVVVSPYMKNALIEFGDLNDGDRLKVNAPLTKAEKYIQDCMRKGLLTVAGEEVLEYDRSLSCTDMKHYAVDNWRNAKWGTDWRQIQPKQAEQREEVFAAYRSAPPETPQIFSNPYVKYAIQNVVDYMPHGIHRSREFKDWTGPFENKHTSTSAPFGYQDDVVVSSENDFTGGYLKPYYGKTYGQMFVQMAGYIRDPELALAMGWFVGYGRNQVKGRGLEAEARLPVIYCNSMTYPETEACRTRCPFFVTYNDRTVLRRAMIEQAEFYNSNEGYTCENFDYHAFDRTISPQWLAIGGAIWSELAADKPSKDIVRIRTLLGMTGLFIDGLSDDEVLAIAWIFGRMFSGQIETNKTENVINAVATTAVNIQIDPDWINKFIRRSNYARMYMGDDHNTGYDRRYFNHDKYVKLMKEQMGFEVHPDKGEYGMFLLQNRLFIDENGEYILTYPWTRVLRSCFMLEKARGLGPAGWTLATWSKLANIREYEPGLAMVRDLVCRFDNQKLMLNTPIPEIVSMVEKEDELAKEEKKRAASTWDVINDGDPGKVQLSKKNSRYLQQLQRDIRESRGPSIV